jgi:hypothetical protein
MTQRLTLILMSVVVLCGVFLKPQSIDTALFFWVVTLLMFKHSDRLDKESTPLDKVLLVALIMATLKSLLA